MTPLVLQLRIHGLSVGLSLLGLYLGLGGGVGTMVVALAGRRAGVSARTALALCFWAASVGIIAARLGGMFGGGTSHGLPLAMSYAVGLAAACAAAAAFARSRELSPWLALDLLGCGLAAAHAVALLGCFAVGCCYGRIAPTGAPFAVTFGQGTIAWQELAARGIVPLAARSTPPLYAVQPIEAVALAILTLLLVVYVRRPRGGRVLGAYLVGCACIWVGLASWRAQPWHGVATVTCLAAAGIALTLRGHAHRTVSARRARTGTDPRRV